MFPSFKTLKPILLAAVIVIGVSIAARLVMADEAPPRQVQESVDAIHQNQRRIAEIRKYVDEFNSLKDDNARLVGRMEAFGYTMNWSKGQAEKADFQ